MSSYYLLAFDKLTSVVHVEPYFAPDLALLAYANAEASDNEADKDTTDIVLVEAGKIEKLRDAYPNYFGDVQLFKEQLKRITKGESAREYTVRPQEFAAQSPKPKENPDLSWFRKRLRWK